MTRLPTLAVSSVIGALAIGASTLVRADVVEDQGGSQPAGNSIVVGAYGVDDDVKIWVDDQLVGTCSWSSNASDCSVKVRVDMGTKTSAKVRFQLTNKVYTGPCLLGSCGKYQGTFYVDNARGEREWNDAVSCHVSNCPGGNSAGIKYEKTVTWSK